MPVINPISDSRKAKEVANHGLKAELFGKLAVAQAQRANGDSGRTVSQLMKGLRKRIREAA